MSFVDSRGLNRKDVAPRNPDIRMKSAASCRALAYLSLSLFTSMAIVGRPVAVGQNREPVVIRKSSVIQVAPPAPVFDQATRQRELAGRRARVAEAIGRDAIMVLFSGESREYAGDVTYPYRQENNLYYLTNYKQPGARLVLTPGNSRFPEILFMPRPRPFQEAWAGHMYTPEEAAQITGVREIWDAREFEPFTTALRNRQPYSPKTENILFSTKKNTPDSAPGVPSGFEALYEAAVQARATLWVLQPGGQQEQRFSAQWASTVPSNNGSGAASASATTQPPAAPSPKPAHEVAAIRNGATPSGYRIDNASMLFAGFRLRKSPMEVAYIQHAIDITAEAIERSWVAAADARWEYEINALVLYIFKLRNADHWGFPPIVGCGPNATTLHYEGSDGPIQPGDLFLMDIGAEYEHYSADVTRTFPVSGKFTPAQAEIYQIVYDAQEAGAKAALPGRYISDVDRAATEVIKDGLLKLGLITDRGTRQYRVWFNHNTSHWLGMNVHDVGPGSAKLEPGMVFTNEPGIYVRPDALDHMPIGWLASDWEDFKNAVRPAFEKHKNTGVRIEDDLLVTTTGVEWLTKAIPRKLSEVENFIARARAEAR